MTNYREILRLVNLGLNRSQIADSLGASRTTVIHTLQRAAVQGLDWQTAEPMSDKQLAALLFPGGEGTPSYKTIQLILKSGQDKIGLDPCPPEPSPHGFTRGSEYYAKGAK